MLEDVLQELNNWFVRGIYAGDYEIKDGSIVLPFLVDGQYFRILGSLFNDGLHKYPDDGLVSERFNGVIWALAVPSAVVSLAEEIAAWNEKNGASPGPYTSESFGGYSYTRATNAQGMAVGWQDVFAARLAPWRKLREYAVVQPAHPPGPDPHPPDGRGWTV